MSIHLQDLYQMVQLGKWEQKVNGNYYNIPLNNMGLNCASTYTGRKKIPLVDSRSNCVVQGSTVFYFNSNAHHW